MGSITSHKCVLTQEHLDAICAKYFVPEEVHPQLPSPDATMHERPAGKVGMYTRFFDYANYHSVKNWNDYFFWVDEFVVPANARFSWFSGSNIVKDRAPAPSEYNVGHVNTLIAQASPFLRFPKEFLCWVGISRNYLLNKDTYPRFEYENGEEMDLNAFIRTADPQTKIQKDKYAEPSEFDDESVARDLKLKHASSGASNECGSALEQMHVRPQLLHKEGTVSFGVGFFFVIIEWPVIGMTTKLIISFGFWPTLSVFTQKVPAIGWVFQQPFITSFNCFFLMPVVDKLLALLQDDLESVFEDDLVMRSSLDFNKKFYNSLGRAPNRCSSSSIGKTRWVVIVHSRNRLGRLDHGLTEF
ncbi:hypothetical protein Tco_1533449 [Tanacetum coccineum]